MNALAGVFQRILARRSAGLAAILVFVGSGWGLRGADPEVTVSLQVPAAETYVLGDDVPLVWRFTNHSTNPLAMLWEGCCRLNGTLTVRASGQPVATLPPGAASFHSFSKAGQLPPGQPADFVSRLADWVKLPAGGELSLSGRYTGVLGNQRPQVPANLALWTGTATSAPTQIKLLHVTDYLSQRVQRAKDRGLAIVVSGPSELPPLAPVTLMVDFKNVSDTRQSFAWPGRFELWLVDEQGQRLEKGTRHLEIPGEVIELPVGGDTRRELRLTAENFEGAEFGRITVFLDLGAADPSQNRVPSSAIGLNWRLGADQIRQLLNDAGGSPAAGLRNPALRLLRTYLPAIRTDLAKVDEGSLTNARARLLKRELELAGCLQPLAPKPGAVVLPVGFNADERPLLALPTAACTTNLGNEASDQIGAVAGVRRHLGWDILVEVRPEPATTLGAIAHFASSLEPLREQLAAPLVWRAPRPVGSGASALSFPVEAPDAKVVIRIRLQSGGVQISLLRLATALGEPAGHKTISNIESPTNASVSLTGPDELRAWLAAAGGRDPTILVVADPAIACSDFLTALVPLLETAAQVAVIVAEP